MYMENFNTEPCSLCSFIHFSKSDKRDSQVKVKRIVVVGGNVPRGVSHFSKAYHMTKKGLPSASLESGCGLLALVTEICPSQRVGHFKAPC